MTDVRVLPLLSGLQLTIAGQPTLRALGNFLKAASVHFKNQRDIQKSPLYTAGSFQGLNCVIANPGDSDGRYLSPATWTDAVLDAYTKVKTLEQAAPADELMALQSLLKGDVVSSENAQRADQDQ